MTTPDTEVVALPWGVLDDYRCFGCSPHNPFGLGLEFAPHPDGLVTRFCLDRGYESYPGVVHGGLLGVVCDEAMGNLIVLRTGLVAFTTGMRMRYLAAPIAGRRHLHLRGVAGRLQVEPRATRSPSARAEIFNSAGELAAASSATYRRVPFGATRDRIALGDEEADRLDKALAASVCQPNAPPPGSPAVTTSQNSVSAAVPVAGSTVAGITVADLTAAITGIVAAELGVTVSSISPDSNLRTMEGADSVKVLRTVAKIERQYDVELDDEDVFGASTVAEIASVVHRALEAA